MQIPTTNRLCNSLGPLDMLSSSGQQQQAAMLGGFVGLQAVTISETKYRLLEFGPPASKLWDHLILRMCVGLLRRRGLCCLDVSTQAEPEVLHHQGCFNYLTS